MEGVPSVILAENSSYWLRIWKPRETLYSERDRLEKLVSDLESPIKELKFARSRVNDVEAPMPRELTTNCRNQLRTRDHHLDKAKRDLSAIKVVIDRFGSVDTVHPNQLIAKGILPDEGLCVTGPKLLYKLCLRLKDLQELFVQGELRMNPVNFIRWRLGCCLQQKPGCFRSICSDLAKDTEYGDYVMRYVMLRAEHLRQRHSSQRFAADVPSPPLRLHRLENNETGRSCSKKRKRDNITSTLAIRISRGSSMKANTETIENTNDLTENSTTTETTTTANATMKATTSDTNTDRAEHPTFQG